MRGKGRTDSGQESDGELEQNQHSPFGCFVCVGGHCLQPGDDGLQPHAHALLRLRAVSARQGCSNLGTHIAALRHRIHGMNQP